ncbi:dipeptidase [candidate division KSB1 bacterium]
MGKKRFGTGLLLLIFILFAACSQQVDIGSMTDAEFEQYAMDVHQKALTLDTHVDIPGAQYATEALDPGIDNPNQRCNLPKMEQGGLDGVFLAVYVGQRGTLDADGYKNVYDQAIGKFEAIHRMTEQMYPERCALAVTPDEVEQIAATGKRVIMIGIENGYPIGDDIARVKEFYDLGTRYITLSHSGHNQICDSSGPAEPMHGGVSDFGKEVIREMNRLGIMVDVSHIAESSYWDVIETSQAPIIASHSACAALREVGRNLNDEQLRALTENGGVIQVVALGNYLAGETPEHAEAIAKLREELEIPDRRAMRDMTDEQREALSANMEEFEIRREEIEKTFPSVNIDDYIKHIVHAVEVAGIDHVGIGTDFDGGAGVPGFDSHAECLNVTKELLKAGFSEEDIYKIWGENLLRAWREVENVAAQMQ